MTNKKFLFIGMAVLLSASLFFLGCDTGGDDDDPPPPPAKSAAENLVDDLGGKATVSGDVVTLTDDVTIPADFTSTVAAGVILTVPTGKTLDVQGPFPVAGTVTVQNGGTLKVPALAATGLPADTNTITYTGDGKVELEQGAKGYYGSSLFVGATADNPAYNWDTGVTGSKVTLKGGNVTELTAGKVTARADTGIAASTSIVVANGATLTIADSVNYLIWGTLTVKDGGILKTPALTDSSGVPLTGDDVVNLIAFQGDAGKIELEQGASGYYGSSLFVSTSTTDGYYKWDADVTGSKVTLKPNNVTELTAGKVTARADTGIATGTSIVVANGATLTIGDSVQFPIWGILTVKNGGTLKAPALTDSSGVPLTGDDVVNLITFQGDAGKIELEQGASGYYGSSYFVSGDTTSLYKWDSDGVNSKVTLKPNNVTEVAGKVTAQISTGIATSTSIVLGENARLTIAANVQFPIWGALTGSTGSTLVNSGTITMNGGASSNFYVSNNSTALSSITAGTYTWATSAGTSSSAGWETPGE
jgi:lipopolysaccharide export system protein LptA